MDLRATMLRFSSSPSAIYRAVRQVVKMVRACHQSASKRLTLLNSKPAILWCTNNMESAGMWNSFNEPLGELLANISLLNMHQLNVVNLAIASLCQQIHWSRSVSMSVAKLLRCTASEAVNGRRQRAAHVRQFVRLPANSFVSMQRAQVRQVTHSHQIPLGSANSKMLFLTSKLPTSYLLLKM